MLFKETGWSHKNMSLRGSPFLLQLDLISCLLLLSHFKQLEARKYPPLCNFKVHTICLLLIKLQHSHDQLLIKGMLLFYQGYSVCLDVYQTKIYSFLDWMNDLVVSIDFTSSKVERKKFTQFFSLCENCHIF